MQNLIPIDLHAHSNYSDGRLSVKQLLDFANECGTKHLALTDHDTVIGVSEAKQYASQIGINLIGGVEISVTWNSMLVHIVGLNINHLDESLIKNLDSLREKRYSRGEMIAKKLDKIGIHGALEGALKFAERPESLSRTHFNRFLVEGGYAKANRAFDQFLAPGKPGYVSIQWASLEDAVSWITNAGGIAVIAHPCRYSFTRTKLLRFIDDFKQCGGLGIEVISSSHSKEDVINIAKIASDTNLYGSVGSDFHNYDETSYKKTKPGINPPLPLNVEPIFPKLNIYLEETL